MKTHEAARGRWKEILTHPSVGIDSKFLGGRHCACPSSGDGEDRFRFSDRAGTGNFFCRCNPDGRHGGIELVKCKTGLGFSEASKLVDEIIGNGHDATEKPDRKNPLVLLQQVQKRAAPPGPAVTSYLEARGLRTPPVLRQITDFEYWDDGKLVNRYDAMLARVVDKAGLPRSWHVTYLCNGGKAPVSVPRKILPPVGTVSGCAVRLSKWQPGDPLGIAEGIETALSAESMFMMPVWACLTRGGLESFDPPDGAAHITVFGDCDRNYAGQAGAYKAAEKLVAKGYKVDVLIPSKFGDWNDIMLGWNDPTAGNKGE